MSQATQILADAVAFLEGTLSGNRDGIFKGQNGGKDEPFGMIQMVGHDGNSVKTYEISLAEGFDMKRYPVGTKMKIPVRISASKDGKRIYYREVPQAPTNGTGSTQARSAGEDALRTTAKL
ncbi:hypothetical protein [Bradyrhizobium sp. CCGUVB23]|uniref:hypothetical protein n=1 Tax=Bradyrhizobium sp. CCGUVB23 TaxID=2949630 RepID=UPI0020B1C38B|nr:hypothetical protein [Bradyrhizobium sp. CCGUVB23]MCP3463079.1 hypothetical protein [Bradyrhizobium sp. CCGUVB23]